MGSKPCLGSGIWDPPCCCLFWRMLLLVLSEAWPKPAPDEAPRGQQRRRRLLVWCSCSGDVEALPIYCSFPS